MTNLLIGIAIGASTMILIFHKIGFNVIVYKHHIGRTIQFMKRRKMKLLDGKELTTDISEN